MMNVPPESGASTASQAPRCERCNAAFRCGALAGDPACWCASLPALPASFFERLRPGARCLCPACLIGEIETAAGDVPQRR
jgi:hypothetical protein